jgi:hypothetical protein
MQTPLPWYRCLQGATSITAHSYYILAQYRRVNNPSVIYRKYWHIRCVLFYYKAQKYDLLPRPRWHYRGDEVTFES